MRHRSCERALVKISTKLFIALHTPLVPDEISSNTLHRALLTSVNFRAPVKSPFDVSFAAHFSLNRTGFKKTLDKTTERELICHPPLKKIQICDILYSCLASEDLSVKSYLYTKNVYVFVYTQKNVFLVYTHPMIVILQVGQVVRSCCSVLQCVALCCSILKCVANDCDPCTVGKWCVDVAVCCSVVQCVLQYVAVCCSMLQCVAVCCQ